jgi:hypothetical protein
MRPRPISLHDLPNLPEVFLGLAALLVIIVGAAGIPVAGMMIAASDAVTVIMGLIMGTSALVSLGLAESPMMKSMFSFLTVSAAFGFLLFIRWLQLLSWGFGGQWQTWTIFVSSLLSLLAAYRAVLLHRY